MHQQSNQAVRLQQQRTSRQRLLCGLESEGDIFVCGDQQWGDTAVGCGQDQAHQSDAGMCCAVLDWAGLCWAGLTQVG